MHQFIDELSAPFRHEATPVLRDWPLAKWLEECRESPRLLATTAERMFNAIRPATMVETEKDERLKRLFGGRTIARYPDFADFFGLESVIEEVVQYYRLAAEGAEIRKKILLLIGPPGSGKSALARRLQTIFSRTTMMVLAVKTNERFIPSPFFEHPMELFERERWRERFREHELPAHLLSGSGPSPWVQRQLDAFRGAIESFHVVEIPCSSGRRQGIARIEPRSEKELDGTAFTGRRENGSYDASGGLNRTGQGLLEIVEMLKIKPLDMLRPLTTAMDEGSYAGHDGYGPIPYRGLAMGHCNRPEWDEFANNPNNDYFRDRIFDIRVPYCLRRTEELKIYLNGLADSALFARPRAPQTVEMLANLAVFSRLQPTSGKATPAMLEVYDGKDPDYLGEGVQDLASYRQGAKDSEGWVGISTRDGFQILMGAYTRDPKEVGVDPKLLLEEALLCIKKKHGGKSSYKDYVEKQLLPDYLAFLDREVQLAYAQARGGDPPQTRFDRYVALAEAWYYDEPYREPGSDSIWYREEVNKALMPIEAQLGVKNPKEFREQVVKHRMRYREKNGRETKVPWDSHEPMRQLIEAQMFAEGTNLGQIIAFGVKRDKKTEAKHESFVACMEERGYSRRQVERLVMWYIAEKKISLLSPDKDEKK